MLRALPRHGGAPTDAPRLTWGAETAEGWKIERFSPRGRPCRLGMQFGHHRCPRGRRLRRMSPRSQIIWDGEAPDAMHSAAPCRGGVCRFGLGSFLRFGAGCLEVSLLGLTHLSSCLRSEITLNPLVPFQRFASLACTVLLMTKCYY